jgi:hypothetical protein
MKLVDTYVSTGNDYEFSGIRPFLTDKGKRYLIDLVAVATTP